MIVGKQLWPSVAVSYDDKIQEVMRGVRLHLDSFVKDLKEGYACLSV